jgi:hypothetical protein
VVEKTAVKPTTACTTSIGRAMLSKITRAP